MFLCVCDMCIHVYVSVMFLWTHMEGGKRSMLMPPLSLPMLLLLFVILYSFSHRTWSSHTGQTSSITPRILLFSLPSTSIRGACCHIGLFHVGWPSELGLLGLQLFTHWLISPTFIFFLDFFYMNSVSYMYLKWSSRLWGRCYDIHKLWRNKLTLNTIWLNS